METGYLVTYSKKNGICGHIGPRHKIICSEEKLIELLQNKSAGVIWDAKWIFVEKYLENHNVKIEVYK